LLELHFEPIEFVFEEDVAAESLGFLPLLATVMGGFQSLQSGFGGETIERLGFENVFEGRRWGWILALGL